MYLRLNYAYWVEQNDYFSNKPLLDTIRVGLNHANNRGFIAERLGIDFMKYFPTNEQLVNFIAEKIKNASQSDLDLIDDDEVLLIFDLIQGWGGKMGRMPYVRPENNPSRYAEKNLFASTYKEFISLINKQVATDQENHYKDILTTMKSLNGVGESFATKHIFFWSKYGLRKNSLPIFDTRMKRLLEVFQEQGSYMDFLRFLDLIATEKGMQQYEVERALFAFSQNYFQNERLIFKEENEIKEKIIDRDIAESIVRQL